MLDGLTGKLVGHTVSTQDEVAGANDIEKTQWETEFLRASLNYTQCQKINVYLTTKLPTDTSYRISPKYLRTLSGASMVKNATHICPGDWGPNKPPATAAPPPPVQAHGKCDAVFSRHRFESPDVYFRNVSGRADRTNIFMTLINDLAHKFKACSLIVKLFFPAGSTAPNSLMNTFEVAIGAMDIRIPGTDFVQDATSTLARPIWTATINLKPVRFPPNLSPLPGLLSLSHVRLAQRVKNPPDYAGIEFIVTRDKITLPVNLAWPKRPVAPWVTWPQEDFHFATTVGDAISKPRNGGAPQPAQFKRSGMVFIWTAGFDRVWTNPKQPVDEYLPSAPTAALLNPEMVSLDPRLDRT